MQPKNVVIITGYSGVGKSTFIQAVKACDPLAVTPYHIATPFKAMMELLWGVDVDDRAIRVSYRPNGRETVGDLMASAFIKFREWDEDVLMPRLRERVRVFASSQYSHLLIDGVRTKREVSELRSLCVGNTLSLSAIEISRMDVVEEKHSAIAPDIYKTLEYLDSLSGHRLQEIVNTSDTLESWAAMAKEYWLTQAKLHPSEI